MGGFLNYSKFGSKCHGSTLGRYCECFGWTVVGTVSVYTCQGLYGFLCTFLLRLFCEAETFNEWPNVCWPQARLRKCSLALPGLVYLQLNSVHCAVVSVHQVSCMSICQQGKSSVRVKLHVGPWVAVVCFVGC